MEEHSSAEGIEHLQAAARELLLAARSFLNVVEEVVEDRDRLAGAATSVVDLLREGLGSARPAASRLETWERAAWAEAAADESGAGSNGTADPDGVDTDPAAPQGGPRRRVRRIAVD